VNVGGTRPAGSGCAGFPITVTIDVDRQHVTTFFDKNGTPTRQTITGRLVLSVANDSTGECARIGSGAPSRLPSEPMDR
jgi:hypothetical protein